MRAVRGDGMVASGVVVAQIIRACDRKRKRLGFGSATGGPLPAESTVTITIRVTPAIADWLETARAEGESRAQLVRRVLGERMRLDQAQAERIG